MTQALNTQQMIIVEMTVLINNLETENRELRTEYEELSTYCKTRDNFVDELLNERVRAALDNSNDVLSASNDVLSASNDVLRKENETLIAKYKTLSAYYEATSCIAKHLLNTECKC